MIKRLKEIHRKYNIFYFRKHPILWLYGAYLTIKYVDNYYVFPAIWFTNFLKVKIKKGDNSKLKIDNRLVFESFLNSRSHTYITIADNGTIDIENEFVLGDGIKIYVATNAYLKIKGKKNESASGITANSIIMVKEYIEFGYDSLIAWDTYFTDCDWHTINDKKPISPTILGNHVWIGIGSKILKGVTIGDDSIVTTNAVVLKGKYPDKSMIGGIPAKVTKNNIDKWSRDLKWKE